MVNHLLFQNLFAWFIKLIRRDLFKNILKSSCMYEMTVISIVHNVCIHNLVTQLKIEYKHGTFDTNKGLITFHSLPLSL